jgi:D-glycero-alpha-D-manno-heptose-7-phosphate kinase
VGILHALHALKGDLVSKHKLATEAIHLEQELLRENVGIQDQITTAHGGLNLVEIDRTGAFQVRPIPISAQRLLLLHEHMLLIYTGIARTASQVAAKQIASIPDKIEVLKRMQAMVYEAADVLTGKGDLRDFGGLLHETWELKRSISPEVSTPMIDDIYARARHAGALGGKLLGAGGGGFVLLFVEPKKRQAVLDALKDFLMVPFEIESSGTHIVLYEPERYSQFARATRGFVR